MRFPGNAGQSSGLSLPREEPGGQHPTSLAAREAAWGDSCCINSSPGPKNTVIRNYIVFGLLKTD